jgi:hypothetical protein
VPRLTLLQRTYQQYNRKYFGNKLPKVSEVDLHWGSIREMGYEWGGEIVINRRYRYRDAVWKLTLLHEMVHLSLPAVQDEHGKEFQKGMLRLAKAGAFEGLW